jgi:hypothetical protein
VVSLGDFDTGDGAMTNDFKTYEGKRCGDCKIRLPTSGHCLKEHAYVKVTDPACKEFKEVGT